MSPEWWVIWHKNEQNKMKATATDIKSAYSNKIRSTTALSMEKSTI